MLDCRLFLSPTTNCSRTRSPDAPQYDATATPTLVKWETLYPAATSASDITLPAAAAVVISGCALGGALSVRSITVPAGSKVRVW
jgi:hypothetical protein